MKLMKRRGAALLLVIGLASGFGGGGCAAAGLAAASPMLAALTFVGDRGVERSLPADLDTSWTATVNTLTRMEISVRETDRSGEKWLVEGVGETVTVHAKLTRITPRMTRLSLRVEAGELLADKQTAAEIGNQVANSLAAPAPPTAKREPPAAAKGVSAEALTALEGEVRRLRSEIEKERTARRPSSGPVFSRGPGVLVVHPTYGVPAELRPTDTRVDGAVAVPSYDVGTPILVAAPRGSDAAGGTAALAVPLSPVSVLPPVPALRDKRSEQ